MSPRKVDRKCLEESSGGEEDALQELPGINASKCCE